MKTIFLLLALTVITFIGAQTETELKALKKSKKDSIAKLQSEVNALQAQINKLPGWRFGGFGTIGASLSEFNNWYAQNSPNVSSGNIGFTINAFANLQQKKIFWRNAININLSWVKFDDKDVVEAEEGFRQATDVFNLSSLIGRKINDKWAISALTEYRTTILNNFNNPSYLDVGVGMSWTPIANLMITANPLNSNFVFSENDIAFESSLGAKVFADYTRKIGVFNLSSNLSLFQSYKDENLSNWTWINSIGYTLWKHIGLGLDFGLRNNKQEALDFALANHDSSSEQPQPNFDNVVNDLQTYWLFGLNYSF